MLFPSERIELMTVSCKKRLLLSASTQVTALHHDDDEAEGPARRHPHSLSLLRVERMDEERQDLRHERRFYFIAAFLLGSFL